VIVSDGLGKKGKIIYFEDSCLPMKLLVTHAVHLKDEVDHLFIPRLVSLHRNTIMCPKFRGAPDIIRLATEGGISVIDEIIDLQKRGSSLLQSFLKIGEKLGASKKESQQAFLKAQQFFSHFQKEWMDRINRLPSMQLFQLNIPTPKIENSSQNISPPPGLALRSGAGLAGGDKGERGPGRLYSPPPPPSPVKGGGEHIEFPSFLGGKPTVGVCNDEKPSLRIAFIGHPYNLFDSDINKDILALTKSLDMEILTSDLLTEVEIDRQIADLSKEIYWSSGREIVGSLFHFLSGGVDGVVFLTSFKCGIDALLQEFIKRRLKVRGGISIPFLVLSFDEHTGREGLTTRLEAFRDVMEEKKKCQMSKPKVQINGE
jgi:predicted nucleotide-binding protein (sugar kinase/HSP70/actin superfamily)